MQKVKEILDSIANTSSRNEKELILSKHKDNKLLRKTLQFVYNPYIVTGLSDKKMKKSPVFREPHGIDDVMEYLMKNNTGTDVDIYKVKSFINQQPQELKGFQYNIVTKKLKCGITAKTINKVFGKGFIPEFNVMLASKFEDNEKKLDDGFIVTEKLDGIRGVAIKDSGNIKFFSRQGQLIEGLTELEEEIKLLPDNYVYDGELLLRNDGNLGSAELYRATTKVVRKDGSKKNVEFYAFDMIPLSEFQDGKSKKGCQERKSELMDVANSLDSRWFKVLPSLYCGKDKSEIAKLLARVEKNGKEGVMVNTLNGKYECKRSKELLKAKTMNTVDLKIIGFEEGTGKYVGKLGRINVDYKGYTVGVGSGYSDQDREYIWNNRESLLGRVIEVQYFEETENQNGGKSLRFPVFKEIREDGKEVSYN